MQSLKNLSLIKDYTTVLSIIIVLDSRQEWVGKSRKNKANQRLKSLLWVPFTTFILQATKPGWARSNAVVSYTSSQSVDCNVMATNENRPGSRRARRTWAAVYVGSGSSSIHQTSNCIQLKTIRRNSKSSYFSDGWKKFLHCEYIN